MQTSDLIGLISVLALSAASWCMQLRVHLAKICFEIVDSSGIIIAAVYSRREQPSDVLLRFWRLKGLS